MSHCVCVCLQDVLTRWRGSAEMAQDWTDNQVPYNTFCEETPRKELTEAFVKNQLSLHDFGVFIFLRAQLEHRVLSVLRAQTVDPKSANLDAFISCFRPQLYPARLFGASYPTSTGNFRRMERAAKWIPKTRLVASMTGPCSAQTAQG